MPPKVKQVAKPASTQPKKPASKLFKDELTTGLRTKKDSPVVKRTFTSDNKEYTKSQIVKEIDKMKEKYAGKNLFFMTSVFIDEVGEFRSSKKFNINDKAIITPDQYQYETSPAFIIYCWSA